MGGSCLGILEVIHFGQLQLANVVVNTSYDKKWERMINMPVFHT